MDHLDGYWNPKCIIQVIAIIGVGVSLWSCNHCSITLGFDEPKNQMEQLAVAFRPFGRTAFDACQPFFEWYLINQVIGHIVVLSVAPSIPCCPV